MSLDRNGSSAGTPHELKWDDTFCCGHAVIDHQHRNLFEIYNGLLDAYYTSHSQLRIHQTLEALLDYIKTHFQKEEALMRQSGYADIDAHIQGHQTLLKQVNDYVATLDHDIPVLTYEVLELVRQWIIQHVRHEVDEFKLLNMQYRRA